MTYIRSFVALAMMVVVAISNNVSVTTAVAPKRRLALWDTLLDKLAPTVDSGTNQVIRVPQGKSGTIPFLPEQVNSHAMNQPAQPERSKETIQLPAIEKVSAQDRQLSIVKPLVESEAINDKLERVRQALELEPDCSDRRLGKLAHMSPVTAKRYRQMINPPIRMFAQREQ